MGHFLYNVFLVLFKTGIRITAIFNSKARNWLNGRKGIWDRLQNEVAQQRIPGEKLLWVHCASLGEFEQGRPLIEKIKAQETKVRILVTFFSPSGYEIRKNYTNADWVFYLPMDGSQAAKRFLEIINPSLVIFVKYEFWYYYLKAINNYGCPLLLISALFRENSIFFKWYGGMHRKMLSFYTHFFVQNELSKRLLDKAGFSKNCTVTGDTRFDRVIEIAEQAVLIPEIETFLGNSNVIVAGSTWPEDEIILSQTFKAIDDPSLKLIIAPHEINKEHISQLQKIFPLATLYSQLQHPADTPQASFVLIIDNIGMLSRLYKYARLTYVGGGFGKGIHNILEAAVYGKPVIFGPAHLKFNEAVQLKQSGGAINISNAQDCINSVKLLLQNEKEYLKSSRCAREYVYNNRGATEKIMRFIQEKRLLTS